MSNLIKSARRATAALRQTAPTEHYDEAHYKLQCMVNVVYDLASRVDRASGSPSFTAAESDALSDLMDAWRVAEPAAVPA